MNTKKFELFMRHGFAAQNAVDKVIENHERKTMAKKKTITIAPSSVDSLAKFAKNAEKKASEEQIQPYPVGEGVVGVLVEVKEIKTKKEKAKQDSFSLVHVIDTENGRRRFWSFGLLDFHFVENKIEPGDMIYVKKHGKDKKDKFWNCDFTFQKSGK